MGAPDPLHARVDVLGVPVSAVDEAAAMELVADWIAQRRPEYATFTGVHGVMEARRSEAVLGAHRGAALVACDGMPMVWACRHAGVRDAGRVYGPDFMLAFMGRAATEGWRSFLYGAGPGVAGQLADTLRRRFPGASIVGAHSPPFRPLTPSEDVDVVAMINESGADAVWVGLSTPKQELWMAEHRSRLTAPALLGVGAAFDFHTGRIPQAPRWIQRTGLEWAFRLATEPRRLAGRYLRNNPRFVLEILRRPPHVI